MTARGAIGIFILVGLSIISFDEWTTRLSPSLQGQVAIVGLPVPVTPPAATHPVVTTGSCEESYKTCLKNAPISASAELAVSGAQACESAWKACVTKKCVTGSPSGGVKQCVKDPDCESSCTENATSQGGLLDCCLGGPQHNNSCPKKIDGKCGGAPASAAPTPVSCTSQTGCSFSSIKEPPSSSVTPPVSGGAIPTARNSPAPAQPQLSGGTTGNSASPPLDQSVSIKNPDGSANSGISGIANSVPSQSQPLSALTPTGSTLASAGTAPVVTAPTAPTGPAFQSTPYNLPAGTAPSTAPVVGSAPGSTAPTVQNGQPTNAWTPGYNSSRYSGGSSPIAVATNPAGSNSFFNGIFALFGGLFSAGSSGSGSGGGSYSSAPARSPVQQTRVENIIQLYVVSPTSNTPAAARPTPAPTLTSPGVSAYDIVIPQTPPASLEGTFTESLSQGNFQRLLALIDSHIPSGEAYGSAPARSTLSSQGGGIASSTASGPETRPSQVSTLDPALTPVQQSSSTLHMTGPSQIAFVQPYAVSASAPAGGNGFSPTLDMIDAYTGGWTGGKIKDPAQSLLANKAALAQVQSNYESAQAALSAWQALASAGLCPESCRETIAALKTQLPNQEKQMQKLSDAVYEGASALSRTSVIDSSIAALARDPQRAAELLTEGTPYSKNVYYGELFPPDLSGNDGTASGTVIKTVARYDLPVESASSSASGGSLVAGEVQSGKSSTGLPELLAHVWNVLTSWLAPAASSTPSGAGCSLLGSLFGFCKNS